MRLKLRSLSSYLIKRPELLFILIAIPFGLVSAAIVPQISITDENSHLLRIHQLSRGEMVCRGGTTYPGEVIDKSKTGDNGGREYTRDFSDRIDMPEQAFRCGSAAGYSLLAYLPQVIGAIFAQLIHPTAASIVLFARIFSLLFYVGAVYFIIKWVKAGKYVFFVVALIPQMIHLAASLSADMMNNVLALSIVAFIINLFTQKHKISKRQILILLGLVAAAALLKKNLILLFLPMLFLPKELFRKNSLKAPFNLQKWAIACCAGVVALVVYIFWAKLTFVESASVVGAANPVEQRPLLFFNLIFNTYFSDYGDLVLRGVFGEFSSFLYHFPTILVVVQIILLLLAYLYQPVSESGITMRNKKWFILASAAAFSISILAITYGMYVEWGLKRGIVEYADGVQGRYFTALLVCLIPVFAWVHKYVRVIAK